MTMTPLGASPPPGAMRDDEVVSQIRANIVFEKMIVSALTLAGLSGLADFALGVATRLAGGYLTIGGAGAALFDAVGFAGLFFLAGFTASAAIGIPLFRFLEARKIRKGWPFIAASLVVAFALLAAMGAAPSFEAPLRLVYLVPPLGAALMFVRKMQPFWRAAECSDAAAASNVFRIH